MDGYLQGGGIERATVSATLEHAESKDGKYRIRGVANSLGIMRSGRLLLPTAFDRQMKKTGGKPNVKLLANHGEVRGFASIGKVESVAVTDRGLVFTAWLAEGTQLADDARRLVSQGALDSLSIGWMGSGKLVNRDDPGIVRELAEALDEAEVSQAYVFHEAELLEISIVDVPDDRNATLAARLSDGQAAALLRPLTERLDRLERTVAALQGSDADGLADVMQAAFAPALAEFLERFQAAAVAALADSAQLVAECGDIHDLAADAGVALAAGRATQGDGDGAAGTELATLLGRLERGAGGRR